MPLDSDVAAVRRYFAPSAAALICISALPGIPILGLFAQKLIVPGLAALLFWGVAVILSWSWYHSRQEEAVSCVDEVCQSHDAAALADDFQHADSFVSGMRIGKHFIFSRYAMQIIPLEAISDVQSDEYRDSESTVCYIVCTVQGRKVRVARLPNPSYEGVRIIRQRSEAVQKQP